MRHVYEHPGEATERAQRARLDIESKLSPEVCGRFVTERIADINKTRPNGPASAKRRKITVGRLHTSAKDTPQGLRGLWRTWTKP